MLQAVGAVEPIRTQAGREAGAAIRARECTSSDRTSGIAKPFTGKGGATPRSFDAWSTASTLPPSPSPPELVLCVCDAAEVLGIAPEVWDKTVKIMADASVEAVREAMQGDKMWMEHLRGVSEFSYWPWSLERCATKVNFTYCCFSHAIVVHCVAYAFGGKGCLLLSVYSGDVRLPVY